MVDEPAVTEEDSDFDLHQIELLLGIPAQADLVFAEYLEHVANDGLRPYKNRIHYSETNGGKAGESLYTHVLNGIFVLEQMRRLLQLTDVETRVLFTAFTVHDINKVVDATRRYQQLATPDYIVPEIARLKLDQFFPDYAAYLNDIIALMQRHSAHAWVGIDAALDKRQAAKLQLGDERVRQLVSLMRAADNIDLSHTLDEPTHKDNFLFHLNSFSGTQYKFVRHRVAEQRGSFTNIIHNAAIAELQARFDLTPLLLYPDGVVYLSPRQHEFVIDDDTRVAIARRITGIINDMTSEGFREFIRPINMGITIDPKCLELNLPWATMLAAIDNIIQKRSIKPDKLVRLAEDATNRTRALLAKRAASHQSTLGAENDDSQAIRTTIERVLAAGPVPRTQEGMRIGELIRSYYIFLIEHLADRVPQPWQHIYALLDMPHGRWAVYDGFDARMDRAYVLATELALSEQEIYTRIERDGTQLLSSQEQVDPRLPVVLQYLEQVLFFNQQPLTPSAYADALPTYVRQQHKQCVQCSLPLPTQKWSSGNVRGDIKVQLFSNRLAGGPGEPVKRVCAICQLQYLVEKLNYREIRGEQTVYFHLFPYSFLTAPFINGLGTTIKQIKRGDVLAGALRLSDAESAITEIVNDRSPILLFTTRTKEDKAQPYGLYLPRYTDTLGGTLVLPLNPAGDNDTHRFLFVLQHALLLQRHLGCKVLVSTSATPPLDKDAFGDVYFDLTPLSARGLVRQNDYHEFQPGTKVPGTLHRLWQQLGHVYTIRHLVATRKGGDWIEIVTGMADHPLRLFYVAEKLAEDKARIDKTGEAGWTMRALAAPVRALALSTGDREMAQLDRHLQRLAEIAWQGNLRGQSLLKNSLLAPLDEVLHKLALHSQELNTEVLQAAATQDLYDHIERVRTTGGQRFSPPRLRDACQQFVQTFFDQVFGDVYHGKVARLLSHEKLLRSAFHFYIRQQIGSKGVTDTGTSTFGPVEPQSTATRDVT